ncbi:hypothetical protein KL953_14200 [Mycolicibacterium goodii]|nr:hypothetical protein [Mycolicibacterium goodii]
MVPSPSRVSGSLRPSSLRSSRRLGHGGAGLREAVRFTVTAAGVAVVFLVMSGVWLSTCVGETADAVACGAPQRTLLTLAAPTVLLVAGMWALARPHQTDMGRGHARTWQGAGLVLLTLMVVVLAISLPELPGSGNL